MHEGAIAQGILTNALGALPTEHQVIITRIAVVIGNLAGVVPESLELFFSELSRGTPAANSCLDLRFMPAEIVCRSCQKRVEHHSGTPVALTCGSCGGMTRLEGGRELYLEEMEVQEISAA